MELWELFAREGIRDTIARYNANQDAGRVDSVIGLFAPDAVLEFRDRTFTGRDGVRSFFAAAIAARMGQADKPTHIRHSTTTLQIDLVNESEAKSRCYFFVVSDAGMETWGRYLDEFKPVDGKWLFSRRRILFDKGGPHL